MTFHNMFGMSQAIFVYLLNELHANYGIHGSSRTTSRELIPITLNMLSHNKLISAACERFKHLRKLSVNISQLI